MMLLLGVLFRRNERRDGDGPSPDMGAGNGGGVWRPEYVVEVNEASECFR